MKGINFVTDENDQKIAVQIDLKQYGDLWEDIYDSLICESRKNEETISLDKLKSELKDEGLL